jgi:hypothetical protein
MEGNIKTDCREIERVGLIDSDQGTVQRQASIKRQ